MVQTRKRKLSEGEGDVDNVSVAKTPRKISSTQHVSSPRPNRTGATPRRSTRASEKEEVDKTDSAAGKEPSTPRRSSRRLSQSLETISEDSPLRKVQNDTPTRTRRGSCSSDLDTKPEADQTLNFDDSAEVTPQNQKSSGSGSTESMGDDLKDNVEKDGREEKRKSIITLDTVVEEEENEADVEEEKSEAQTQTGVVTDCADTSSAKKVVCKSSLGGKNEELVSPEEVAIPGAVESEDSEDLSRNESEVVDSTGNQSECLSLRENVEKNEKQVEDIVSKADDSVKQDFSSCDAGVENVDDESCSTEAMADESDAFPAVEETVEVTEEEENIEQSVGLDQKEGGDTSHSGQVEEKTSEMEVIGTDSFTGEEKENVSLETVKCEKVVSEGENGNFKSDELMEKSGKQNNRSSQKIEKKENAKTLDVPNPVLGQVPRGQPKSGRWWKNEKKRFSSVIKVKPLRTSWAKKMQVKEERQTILAASAAVKEEKRQKLEQLRERQRINKEKREENARKAEIVQLIKDPRKIKKMKRKQLRQIEKRDPGSIRK